MSVEYCTIEDIRLYSFQYDEEADRAIYNLLIPRGSAVFDKLCGVSPGYFLARAEADPATEKTFYGTGGLSLTLPPFVGDLEITMPSGYTVPPFVNQEGILFLTDSQGMLISPGAGSEGYSWPKGVKITIKAKWGYAKTPDEVVEAVAELVVAMYRSRDSAFLRQINLENHQTVNSALPPRTKAVIHEIRSEVAAGVAFV